MARGRFITFEGGEGCGKTTQIRRLESALRERGLEVVLTREPGGTWLGEKIRTLLKDQTEDPPCARAELLLFFASRAQLVKNVIRPALARGAWVLSDRFADSSLAYQGYGRGLPLTFIRETIGFACEGLKPDRTLLLDLDPAVARERMRSRERATHTEADRIERAGEDFHARLHAGFAELAASEPERIFTIDANGTPDEVWENVWKSMKPLL